MINLLLLPILLPMVVGVALLLHCRKAGRADQWLGFATVCVTAVLVGVMIFCLPEGNTVLVQFTSRVSFALHFDGLGKFFAGMVSFLWPFSLYYAFVYLKEDPRKYTYFSFYVMTYGTVLGIAFAANALTLYVFYELLTFVTLPLIMHTQTREARRAGRHYLYYSLSGSSLALSGIVILTVSAGTNDFLPGGVLQSTNGLLLTAYLFLFFGFGVKAAVLPCCGWLPEASAAPTPTTALLHAVAVVKAGAFAILRVTYENFSPDLLRGTWAQRVALACAALTVIYGSSRAVREQHFKRRFAYSTVANLSYILAGALFCTEAGLHASIMHFLFHSLTKIGLFFCIGAVIETTGAHDLFEMNGFGRKMPKIFTCYTVSGCSLVGVPLFAGFVSKFYLVRAGLQAGTATDLFGVGAIILSAVLTAFYVLSVSFRVFVRRPNPQYETLAQNVKEPETGFLVICGVFAALVIVFGVCATPISAMVNGIVGGIV